MRTRALALPAIIAIILTSTAYAQNSPRQLPTIPTIPGTPHQPQTTIVIPPNPTGGTQESTIIDLNTGTVTIIQQTGNDVFILRP